MFKFKKHRKHWYVILVIVALLVTGIVLNYMPTEGKITISRETTYILGPVNPDGTVNYVTYLNAKYKKGVTPDNNAAVLLIKAFGPESIYSSIDEPDKKKVQAIRSKAFKALGMDPLPENGKYFISLEDFTKENQTSPARSRRNKKPGRKKHKEKADLMDIVTNRPWSADEFPLVAKWLERNAGPLKTVVEATKRTRYFYPIVSLSDPPQLFGAAPPPLNICKEALRALVARAMFRLRDNKPDEAWSDLMAGYRLGSLLSQDGTLIGNLVAIAISGKASSTMDAFLAHAELPADRLRAMLTEFDAVPQLCPLEQIIYENERFMVLDCVMTLARSGNLNAREMLDLLEDSEGGGKPKKSHGRISGVFDWDVVLRAINECYEQMRKSQTPDEDLVERTAKTFTDHKIWSYGMMLGGRLTRHYRSRWMGGLMISIFVPSLSRVFVLQERVLMNADLARLALAIEIHKAETGSYPQTLGELTPGILKKIPPDRFAKGDRPPKYVRTEKGYYLYSLGDNGRDDGGLNWRYDDKVSNDEDDKKPDDLRFGPDKPDLSRTAVKN